MTLLLHKRVRRMFARSCGTGCRSDRQRFRGATTVTQERNPAGDVPCDHLLSTAILGTGRLCCLFKKRSADQIMSSSGKSSTKEIRILIADDHPVVREGLMTILALQKGDLLKGAEPRQVWDTIREVFAGKSSLPPDVAAQLADSMALPQLSQRELQVLKQMALGKSNKEIGQILYISEYTVKSHVKVILKKLNAIGRTEAIAIASQRGLINMG
jgi:DNA-binding CsgD family transcriptional regulator